MPVRCVDTPFGVACVRHGRLNQRRPAGCADVRRGCVAAAGEHPFPLETLQALARLIPCDVIGYAEMDRVARRELDYVGNARTPVRTGSGDRRRAPLCRHQLAYADFSAVRLSDVISRRRLINSHIYADWFAPRGSRRSSRSASSDRACVRVTSCSSGPAATSRTVTGRCLRSCARTWRGSTR